MANKIVVAAVGAGIVIAAVPSVMYFNEKQANQEQVKSNSSSYSAESTNTVTKDQTNDIRQAEQNTNGTTGGETVNREENRQQANSTGGTTTTNSNVSTQNNSGSNTVPQATTPAPTSSPAPYVPPVDWWDVIFSSYSPVACGEADSRSCPRGTEVSVTANFADRNTGELITITSCSAEGFMSIGPTNEGTKFATQTLMVDNKTCTSKFTPPNYGKYGIFLTVTTAESQTHPQLSFNSANRWWISP